MTHKGSEPERHLMWLFHSVRTGWCGGSVKDFLSKLDETYCNTPLAQGNLLLLPVSYPLGYSYSHACRQQGWICRWGYHLQKCPPLREDSLPSTRRVRLPSHLSPSCGQFLLEAIKHIKYISVECTTVDVHLYIYIYIQIMIYIYISRISILNTFAFSYSTASH